MSFKRAVIISALLLTGLRSPLNAHPSSQSEPQNPTHEPDFYTFLDFTILPNGQTFAAAAPMDPLQHMGTYGKTLRVEYTTVSGKVFNVQAERPVYGNSTAVIPTDESGKEFRVFDQEGNLLGERWFSPEPPLAFKVEEHPGNRISSKIPPIFPQGMSSRTYVRWSWDGGKTWEWHVGPLEMELNAQEAELPKDGLLKNPHPLVEVIVPSGLTFHRKRFVYKGEQP